MVFVNAYLAPSITQTSVNSLWMDIGDIISHELLTAEEEHDGDLAEHSLRRHVPIADRGAGHHQEPDGVQVVKAPRLWPVVRGEL